jgi:nucleolar protein 56
LLLAVLMPPPPPLPPTTKTQRSPPPQKTNNHHNHDHNSDMQRFGKLVKLLAFKPFASAAAALEEANAVSESSLTDDLRAFVEQNVPKGEKSKKSSSGSSPPTKLGVSEPKLGSAIQEATGVSCVAGEAVGELLRGVRLHFTRLLGAAGSGDTNALRDADLQRAQLGLAHSYSRAKVKFNVNKVDNMIIQAIALLDTLDKDVNTFVMRVREWYGWHFPELVKVVPDNYQYSRAALAIGDKSTLSEASLPALAEALGGDDQRAKDVLDAARASMGQDISPVDLVNIETFARRVISLAEYRHNLAAYLQAKMQAVAPNLAALIGDVVGARLISKAGSLTNLAKYPASTVQILGAEKALFRALKTKGNTPKYGLIFHSSFIGRAKARNKGRISRYLANKCSIASRIDAFMDGSSSSVFGQKMREQVEERLRFYEEGVAPRKNSAAMAEAMALAGVGGGAGGEKDKKKDKKKDKEGGKEEKNDKKEKGEKKDKKDKKEKKRDREEEGGEKKKKKKK